MVMIRKRPMFKLQLFVYLGAMLMVITDASRITLSSPIGWNKSSGSGLDGRLARQQSDANMHLAAMMLIRGGDIDIPDSEGDDAGILVRKVRNLVRSLLSFGDAKAPILSMVLRPWFGIIGSITGTRLLPRKASPIKAGKTTTKTSKATSKKTSKSKIIKDDSESDDGTTATTKKASSKKVPKQQKPSVVTQKHLTSSIKVNNSNYRIQQELKEFIKSPPPNLSVKVGSNIRIWVVTMIGAKNTLYEGEVYKLRIKFPPQYPTVPPSVYFLKGNVPTHEHVYTNGDICLSLLGKGWRPTMTAQSIAVSILSILSSAQQKVLPMDNSRQALNKPGAYQKDWVYHDDNC